MECLVHPDSLESGHDGCGARLDGDASVEGAVGQGVGGSNGQVYSQVVAGVDLVVVRVKHFNKDLVVSIDEDSFNLAGGTT